MRALSSLSPPDKSPRLRGSTQLHSVLLLMHLPGGQGSVTVLASAPQLGGRTHLAGGQGPWFLPTWSPPHVALPTWPLPSWPPPHVAPPHVASPHVSCWGFPHSMAAGSKRKHQCHTVQHSARRSLCCVSQGNHEGQPGSRAGSSPTRTRGGHASGRCYAGIFRDSLATCESNHCSPHTPI